MFLNQLPDMSRYQHIFQDLQMLKYFPDDLVTGESITERFEFRAGKGYMELMFHFGGVCVQLSFPFHEADHTRFSLIITGNNNKTLASKDFYPDHPKTVESINALIVNTFYDYFCLDKTSNYEEIGSKAAALFIENCFRHETYYRPRPTVETFRRLKIAGSYINA